MPPADDEDFPERMELEEVDPAQSVESGAEVSTREKNGNQFRCTNAQMHSCLRRVPDVSHVD